MGIQGYLSEIRALYAGGQTTEHSFRPALAKLFTSIGPAIAVIDEPTHVGSAGVPVFVSRGA